MIYEQAADIKVLIGCERSKTVRNAFLKLGFDAYSCDLQQAVGGNDNRHIQDDIREVIKFGEWDLMAVMHPPCTRLCNSGVRWLSNPPKKLNPENYSDEDCELYKTLTIFERHRFMWNSLKIGADLFSDCWNAPNIKHIAVENPTMHLHAKKLINNYEEAKQHVQPWWFGEEAFKSTGLYLKNLPPLIPTNKLVPPVKKENPKEHAKWSAIHRASPGKNRSDLRSKTFQGIADAMASQWGEYILKQYINEAA